MANQNYYEVLGVANDADLDTIKKAYRKLVRKYHPDVSKEADAIEKTAQVNEAYETLKDPEKRADYDAMLANPFGSAYGAHRAYQDNDGFQHYEFRRHNMDDGPFGQNDFHFEDLFSAFGTRQHTYTDSRTNEPIKGEDQHAELNIDIDAAYHGTERTLTLNIPDINQQGGIIYREKTLNVKIPKGITEGQQIRLSGQGFSGFNGGANGDLYLTVRFHEKPELYVKNKKDVYQTVDIMPWQAVLGGKVQLSTVAGRLQINLPANSQSGKSIRLKGKGIPAKISGDLYLNIRIIVPHTETDADRAAWEQLAAHFSAKNK